MILGMSGNIIIASKVTVKVPVMVGAFFGGNLRFSPRMAYREDFGILLVRRVYGGTGTEKPARVERRDISDCPSEAPQTYVPLVRASQYTSSFFELYLR